MPKPAPSYAYEPNPLGHVVGTYGWIGASHTYLCIDPQNKVIALLFSQFRGVGQIPIIFEFNGLVYDGLQLE